MVLTCAGPLPEPGSNYVVEPVCRAKVHFWAGVREGLSMCGAAAGKRDLGRGEVASARARGQYRGVEVGSASYIVGRGGSLLFIHSALMGSSSPIPVGHVLTTSGYRAASQPGAIGRCKPPHQPS